MTNNTESEDVSWISWFCSLPGNEFFCEVDEDFIKDKFNLTGLNEAVPHYGSALRLILDLESPEQSSSSSLEDLLTGGRDGVVAGAARRTRSDLVESAAELLYGCIHARFVMSLRGISLMLDKFTAGKFGACPRVYCDEQAMLPIGLSDIPGEGTVKLYCPKCEDIYLPKSSKHHSIDGAYFGTGLPTMLFMDHPDYRPKAPTASFAPRLYGFKIHPTADHLKHKIPVSATGAELATGRSQLPPSIKQNTNAKNNNNNGNGGIKLGRGGEAAAVATGPAPLKARGDQKK